MVQIDVDEDEDGAADAEDADERCILLRTDGAVFPFPFSAGMRILRG
jgi:hypothetical protein